MTFTCKDTPTCKETRRFPDDRIHFLAHDRDIVEAIAAGDGSTAAAAMAGVITNGRVRRAAKVKSDAGTSPGRPAHCETRRERRRIAAFAPPFLSTPAAEAATTRTPAAAAATNRMSEYP